MRKRRPLHTRLLAALLTILLTLSLAVLTTAAQDDCLYDYQLYVTATADPAVYSLDVYTVVHRQNRDDEGPTIPPAGPFLTGGAYGLAFPNTLRLSDFRPEPGIEIRRLVPTARNADVQLKTDNYHAMAWICDVNAELADLWHYDNKCRGYAVKLGSYEINLDPDGDGTFELPTAQSLQALDWMTIPEAVPAEVGGTAADPLDRVNRAIWNPETARYQGFYAVELTAVQQKTDIGFLVETPWPSAACSFELESYDPKDGVLLHLYKGEAATAAYTLWLPGEDGGVGLSTRTLQLDGKNYVAGQYAADQITPEMTRLSSDTLENGTYRIEVIKQSHVRATLTNVTISENGLFPELKDYKLHLPCGDVDGDGHIGQKDRGILTARERYGKAAVAGEPYDLDGDGLVNQKDLAILTAPENYGKNDLTITFGDDGV